MSWPSTVANHGKTMANPVKSLIFWQSQTLPSPPSFISCHSGSEPLVSSSWSSLSDSTMLKRPEVPPVAADWDYDFTQINWKNMQRKGDVQQLARVCWRWSIDGIERHKIKPQSPIEKPPADRDRLRKTTALHAELVWYLWNIVKLPRFLCQNPWSLEILWVFPRFRYLNWQ